MHSPWGLHLSALVREIRLKQAPGPKRMPLAKPPKGHLEFLLRSLIERGLWEQAHLQKLLFPPLSTSSPTQSSRWDHTSCACSEKPALLPFAQRQCRDRLRLRGLKSSSWPRGQPGPGQQNSATETRGWALWPLLPTPCTHNRGHRELHFAVCRRGLRACPGPPR